MLTKSIITLRIQLLLLLLKNHSSDLQKKSGGFAAENKIQRGWEYIKEIRTKDKEVSSSHHFRWTVTLYNRWVVGGYKNTTPLQK